MKKIAITGGIGSGKSKCSSILREMDYEVFDCDASAKKLRENNLQVQSEIANAFSECVNQGKLNTLKLAEHIFQHPEAKQVLQDLLLPHILNDMNQQAKACQKEFFFAEVPLLFEVEWQQYFDGSLLISADETVRIERLMNQRGLLKRDIEARIANQMNDKKKRQLATWVIENNQNEKALKEKIKKWLSQL